MIPTRHAGPVALAICAAITTGAMAITVAAESRSTAKPASSRLAEASATPETTKADFGLRLANAAMRQTAAPVVYDPSYVKIPYPMGDIPWYKGVCSDVIVRAYRDLGIDLQVSVHKARVGSGDTNIDHRRVRVLRKYFARYGRSLKPSKDPADYKPGDIVTYYLPEGWFSKDHIGIVSDRTGPSGAPFVIHNRGWGVQLEDYLFSEKITGHYRYTGRRG